MWTRPILSTLLRPLCTYISMHKCFKIKGQYWCRAKIIFVPPSRAGSSSQGKGPGQALRRSKCLHTKGRPSSDGLGHLSGKFKHYLYTIQMYPTSFLHSPKHSRPHHHSEAEAETYCRPGAFYRKEEQDSDTTAFWWHVRIKGNKEEKTRKGAC